MQGSTHYNQIISGAYRYNRKKVSPVKIAMNLIIVVVVTFAHGTSASAEPMTPVSLTASSGLQPVGTGTIRWFGFTIYDASLFTASGNFSNVTDSLPVALHITYQKNINFVIFR